MPLKAHTISLAELRRTVESPGDEVIRAVPLLEREERQEAQKFRLAGLDLEADLSQPCLNRFNGLTFHGRLKWSRRFSSQPFFF